MGIYLTALDDGKINVGDKIELTDDPKNDTTKQFLHSVLDAN